MAENTYLISLQGVEVSYPKNGNRREGRNVILNNIRLNIRAGEFLSLVGPTGCGLGGIGPPGAVGAGPKLARLPDR